MTKFFSHSTVAWLMLTGACSNAKPGDATLGSSQEPKVSEQSLRTPQSEPCSDVAGDYTFVTINLGLMNGLVGGSVPLYDERRKLVNQALESVVTDQSVDLLFLQELWYSEDVKLVRDYFTRKGYLAATVELKKTHRKDPRKSLTGLEILVAPRLSKQLSDVRVRYTPYVDENGDVLAIRGDRWSVQTRERGLLTLSAALGNNGCQVHFQNTHLSWDLDRIDLRKAQLEFVKKDLAESKANWIVLGADLNFSDVFENAFGSPESELKGTQEQLEANVKLYESFIEESSYVDVWRTANPTLPGYTQDRNVNPIARESVANEYEQRLDYLMTKVQGGAEVQVLRSELVFNQRLGIAFGKDREDGMKEVFLSDHLGVLGTIRLGRP